MRVRLPLLLLVVLAGACTPEPAPATPPREGAVKLTPALLEAFRDYVYAYYEVRLLADPGYVAKGRPEDDLDAARKNQERAQQNLARALGHNGDRASDVVPVLREAIVKKHEYALIDESEDEKAISFALVRLVRSPEVKTIDLFGEKWSYELSVFDDIVIKDYASYRAARLSAADADLYARRIVIPLGKYVYFDLSAAARIGREKFFPNVAAYRERARLAMESDAPFTATKGDAVRLLAVTKDVLRWRSLESFWGKVQARPEEEQGRLFAEDYVEREEVRAACEAYYLDRIRQKTTDRPVGKPLVELEEKTYLAAILLGEPLGQVATVAGLASEWSQKRGSPDPVVDARLRAAATVTLALVKALAPAAPLAANEDGDVRDCARLARARPDELTKAARAVLDQLN